MKVQIIPVTHYQQNCSLIWCEKSKNAAFVDPGGDIDRLEEALKAHELTLSKIILTHGHLDHVGGTAALKAKYDVPIEGPHEADRFWIEGLEGQAKMMGFGDVESFEPDRWLKEGDTVQVGEEKFEIFHCPGHTPGHVVVFHREIKLAFVGDVLFQGSIGRTDFPQGNYEQLVDSIRSKLWPLGDDVTFIPGHGPHSTFGHERRHNQFVADARFG